MSLLHIRGETVNRLLATLPKKDYERLLPGLKRIPLIFGLTTVRIKRIICQYAFKDRIVFSMRVYHTQPQCIGMIAWTRRAIERQNLHLIAAPIFTNATSGFQPIEERQATIDQNKLRPFAAKPPLRPPSPFMLPLLDSPTSLIGCEAFHACRRDLRLRGPGLGSSSRWRRTKRFHVQHARRAA